MAPKILESCELEVWWSAGVVTGSREEKEVGVDADGGREGRRVKGKSGRSRRK